MRSRIFSLLFLCFALAGLPACSVLQPSGESEQADSPTPTPSLRIRGPALATPPAGEPADEELDEELTAAYRLRALDPVIINLRSIPVPQDIEDIIDEGGTLNLPFIGRVKAAGLTTTELEQRIQRLYLDQQIYKQITVNVVSASQSYYVRGEVKQPGRYPRITGVTIVQAIAAAGGFTEFANPKKVKIIRAGKTFVRNVEDLERDPEKDEAVDSGDVIVVPRSIW